MNPTNQLCVKLLHCGNRNIANPKDNAEKSNFYIPMGLLSMASYLKTQGFDVEIINLDLENGSIEEILDFRRLDAVGLDCHWINQGVVVIETAALIKKIKPEVVVFLGGYTASFFWEEILETYPFIDAVIRGDGEVPLAHLCSVLAGHIPGKPVDLPGVSLAGVPNLAWRGTQNKILFNDFSFTAAESEMNTYDFADFSLLRNWSFYRDLCKFRTQFSPLNQVPVFFLEVGRGCRNNCSYCGGNSRAQKCISNREGVVVRSIPSVVSTIKKAASYGYSLMLTSFEFEGSDQWYSRLFRKIKQEEIKINFVYESWGLPSRFLVNELAECFEHVIIGISPESADLDLRKTNRDIRLFYSNEQLEECLEHISNKSNIKVQLFFSYFLPFETQDTVVNTLDYMVKLIREYPNFLEIFYYHLCADPGALLYLDPKKYQVDLSACNFSDYLNALKDIYVMKTQEPHLNKILVKPGNMTGEELMELTKKIQVFKGIFSRFIHSASLILDKMSQTNVILDYLKEVDLSEVPIKAITLEIVRNVLVDICHKYNIESTNLVHTINKEYEISKQEYGDDNLVNKIEDIQMVSELEKNRIRSTIRKARREIDASFDL